MKRRSESADETRQRIVRATYELHSERGIAGTTMRDIAARADVAVGSVYHHFPAYDDVIAACGAFTAAHTQPPRAADIDRGAPPPMRLRAVVEACYGFYARFPAFERVRAERGLFDGVEQFMREEEKTRRALIGIVTAPRKPTRAAAAFAFALLDAAVYRALVASGLSHAGAVDETVAALAHRLFDT